MKFKRTEAPYRGGVLKNELIQLRGNKCEICGLSVWNDQPIPLEAHHIDGDRCNNNLDNLQLLCPNCHTLTPNYGSKNKKGKEVYSDEELIEALQNHTSIRQTLVSLGLSDAGANYGKIKQIILDNPEVDFSNLSVFKGVKINRCLDCGKVITPGAIRCHECDKKSKRVTERPSREELKKLVRSQTFVSIAKQFGVSDRCIAKWCKSENLPSTKKEINSLSDEEWENI